MVIESVTDVRREMEQDPRSERVAPGIPVIEIPVVHGTAEREIGKTRSLPLSTWRHKSVCQTPPK